MELEFRPPVTAAWLLIKINIKNQCLAMLIKLEPKPGLAQRLDLFPSIVLSNTLLCHRDHLHIHLQKPLVFVRVNEMS